MALLEAHTREFSRTGAIDRKWLQRLKHRETGAWTELFEREHPVVYRAVLAQVGDPSAAEDITGQVFLEAIEGTGRYRDRGKPITAWLLTIARHRAIDWRRKRQNRHEPIDGDVAEAAVPAAPSVGDALSLMQQLTPEQREVMLLRFVEGYSLEETARLTGRSTGSVKALQHRAVRRLRAVLGTSLEDLRTHLGSAARTEFGRCRPRWSGNVRRSPRFGRRAKGASRCACPKQARRAN